MKLLRWLRPGLRLKRWLALFAAGLLLLGAGFGVALGSGSLTAVERFVAGATRIGGTGAPSRVARGLVVLALGGAAMTVSIRQLAATVAGALVPGGTGAIADAFYLRKRLQSGPKVVAIGGGTGLSSLLRGLKRYTSNLTVIVTVADDGGSSGRLRGELGVLPPGDIRNCLVALADTEPLMEKLFQYRFGSGTGLAGHSFGNLFIAALTEVAGDFEDAVRQSSRILAVRGRVLPSTLEDVTLNAEMEDGAVVAGESSIPKSGGRIKRVYLAPAGAKPLPEAIQAIEEADLVVIGPGSLYTSIMPNLLIHGIPEALRRTRSLKLYVCNVMTQPGETDGYTVADHVRAITQHAGQGAVDAVLVNSQHVSQLLLGRYREQGAVPVITDAVALRGLGVDVHERPMIGGQPLARHDPERLARAVLDVLADGGGRRRK